jgi:hypothetical protein
MTKNIKLLLSCGAVAALGVLAIQGCSSSGDDSTTPSGGSAGMSAGGGAAGKGGGSSAGTSSGGSGTAGKGGATAGGTGGAAGASTTGEAGESAGGAAADLVDCTTFCSDEEATCTFGAATAAPYADSASCMSACMGFTPGDVGVYPDGPTSGDTYACRRWHLSKAGSTPGTPATAAMHCPHTGLLSKAAYTDTTATGPCSG